MSKYSDPITATGSLITFDAPSGGVFDSLSVPITPTQDLHGYSNPWPAGGGKNLLNYETFENKAINNSGAESSASTRLLSALIDVTENSAYFISFPTGYRFIGFCNFDSSGNWVNNVFTNNSVGVSITPTSPKIKIYFQRSDNGAINKSELANAQLEKGSTATSYAPYSNICPISGRTGLSVYVSPTTAQADATTYAVDWTDEAGTVYGGTLDVVTGVLTVDRGIITDFSSLSATASLARDGTYMWSLPVSNVFGGASQRSISSFAQYRRDFNYGGIRFFGFTNGFIYIFLYNNDRSEVLALLDGQQIAYELATPLTYQLTPTQISMLVGGQNNVWIDTSAVITLIYRLLQVDRQTDRTSIGKRAESLDVLGKFSSISKVEVNVTENLFYEAGDSSGRTLTVDCPFGTQAMANNLLAMLQGYVYQPFEARRSIANPATELGDGVTVGDVYGGIYAIYHKCGPLHLADLSAPADEEIDHEYKFTPAFERKVERRLNNMQSELSVQAGEIAAKVDEAGGSASNVSWVLNSQNFKVKANGADVLTVDRNGLTVQGDGNFTGNVYAGNIRYGGSAGTMSGNGITSRSIGTGRLTSGINVSLGNADYSADVFSGAVVARFMKANVMSTTTFNFNNIGLMLNTRTVKDGSGNNLTIKYLGVY